jgi:hypothetical protein
MANSTQYSRLFTINEANALLPTVRPLVEAVLESIRRLRAKSEVVIRARDLDPDAPDLMERLQEDDEIARLIKGLRARVDEINSYGCVCKGAEQGLIDFPCMIANEVVFLCWQIGEPSVSYWHRIEDGFAGRRPLLDPSENDPGSTSLH